MKYDSYNKGKIKLLFIVFLRYLYISVCSLFIELSVDLERLEGIVEFRYRGVEGIATVLICGVFVYLLFKRNKLVKDLFLVGTMIGVISNLLIIETSNFSLYNVILILSCVLDILLFLTLRKSKDVDVFFNASHS